MNKVYVILGPTSSGKTSLALKLCHDFNGVIVSADSRQIYKYMDIGTGKVPVQNSRDIKKSDIRWVMDGVDVWGYDLVAPGAFYSAYDYAMFAREKIKEIQKDGKTIFLVGGTGFYIDMLTGRTHPSYVLPNFELRKELESLTTKELYSRLMSLNVEALSESEKNNKNRLVRRIERILGTKISLSPLPELLDTDFVYLGLTAPRSELYVRADSWVEVIWKNGLIEETADLMKMGFENTPQLSGLIYKTVISFIKKEVTEEEAIQFIKFDLHQYIRRQLTYFKRNEQIKWFDTSQDSTMQNVYNVVTDG